MSWKFVCNAADVPENAMKQFDVDNVPILLVHTEGSFFAIPPLCPHMEEPLVTGICDGPTLICLKHLWQWDLPTGEPSGEAEVPLLKYEVRTEPDGSVHVLMDHELRYDYQA